MDLKMIKSKLDDFVFNVMEAIETSELYKKAVLYKFELSLIACVFAGSILEMCLYINSRSPWWGLVWLLPIYRAYKGQLKLMQTNLNT